MFGIGMGPSSEEKQQYGKLSSMADFATGEGEKDILASDNFWQSILSGDPSSIAKVLGPEISGVNARGQQQKKTASEFGDRGGGTNAAMQMADDSTRSSIDEMISSLTGHAEGALGSSGMSLFGMGESAHEAAFNEADIMHQERSAQLNDIFKSITSIAGALIPGKWGAKIGSVGK